MQQRLQEELYWKQRWANKRIGWHLSSPHTSLVEHIELLAPRPMEGITNSTQTPVIFLPLCGKTLDIHWLRDQGYNVIGCEVSAEALKQLFLELETEPQISKETTSQGNEVEVWETFKIKIYCCNIFDLGTIAVTAIFDRAALVALPADTRHAYTQHILKATKAAPQLLVAFEHSRDSTPPHSVPLELVNEYYGSVYSIDPLSRRLAYDGIIENTYLLIPKDSANI